jgi:hypothetical protein
VGAKHLAKQNKRKGQQKNGIGGNKISLSQGQKNMAIPKGIEAN